MRHCPECDYPNDPSEHRCEKCGIRFDLLDLETPSREEGEAKTASAPSAFLGASMVDAGDRQPLWQGEVVQRVARFRQRQRSLQAALPLEIPDEEHASVSAVRGKIIPFPTPDLPAQDEPRQSEPLAEPPIETASDPGHVPASRQQRLEFGSPAPPRAPALQAPGPGSRSMPVPFLNFPVASLTSRFRAATWDAMIVLAGYGLLAATYLLSGGLFPQHRITAVATVIGLALLPCFYHYLFLMLCSATPGMRWEHLRLVDFDGRPVSSPRRLARTVTAVFSGAPFLVGFLWATLDEEALTWHDRMSETCLTAATPARLKRSR